MTRASSFAAKNGLKIAGFILAASVGATLAVAASMVIASGASTGDWLQFSGGAIGSVFAVTGAYGLESWRRRSEEQAAKSEVLREVLHSYRKARAIFEKANRTFPQETRKGFGAACIAAEAGMMSGTLHRLLDKPHLSDGAVEVGVGGITLMELVLQAAAVLDEDDGINHPIRASNKLLPGLILMVPIEARYQAVVRHGKALGLLGAETAGSSGNPADAQDGEPRGSDQLTTEVS